MILDEMLVSFRDGELIRQKLGKTDHYPSYYGSITLTLNEYLETIEERALFFAEKGTCPIIMLEVQGIREFLHSDTPPKYIRQANKDTVPVIIDRLPEIPRAVWDKCVRLFGRNNMRIAIHYHSHTLTFLLDWHKAVEL